MESVYFLLLLLLLPPLLTLCLVKSFTSALALDRRISPGLGDMFFFSSSSELMI